MKAITDYIDSKYEILQCIFAWLFMLAAAAVIFWLFAWPDPEYDKRHAAYLKENEQSRRMLWAADMVTLDEAEKKGVIWDGDGNEYHVTKEDVNTMRRTWTEAYGYTAK
jgi:hypothetical protein